MTDPGKSSLANGDETALDELVKRTKAKPGAPFSAIPELAVLKKANRGAFETLRKRLKEGGCRVTQLDGLIADENGEKLGRGPTHADILVNLAEVAELFHTPDEIGYADLEIGDHRETWPVKSRGFRRWLRRRFFEDTGGAPTNEAMAAAVGVIEAKAVHAATVRAVHVRVGELDGKVYLDLCDDKWRAIEIDKAGWRIVERPAVRFRRSSDMRTLPAPKRNGSVGGLRKLLNIAGNEDGDGSFVLAVAYLLACLRERGPYPIVVVTGEQGTAKSTRSALLASVVDPRHPRLRGLPRDERDLFVAARTRHILIFDNLSGISAALSDALCRIASGAGFGTRANYTDDEEVLFDGARPIILNGIEDIVNRPDLADRSIFSTCELIDDEDRLSEAEVWRSFDAAHPSILGALLDAVSTGLRNEAAIRPQNLPRMADFAHWAIACEPALWKDGAFMSAYSANIATAVESIVEATPVALAVCNLMAGKTPLERLAEWKGTASELLDVLSVQVGERISRSDTWPKTPHILSGRLRRVSPSLRKLGIDVTHQPRADPKGTRIICLTNIPSHRASEPGKTASEASERQWSSGQPHEINDIANSRSDALSDASDALGKRSSEKNSLEINASDASDASDALSPYSSDPPHEHMPPPLADASDAPAPPFSAPVCERIGPGTRGQKCDICGYANYGVVRVKVGDRQHAWHLACAAPKAVVTAVRRLGGSFDADGNPDLTKVRDPAVAAALIDAIVVNADAIFELLRREARGRLHVSNREPP